MRAWEKTNSPSVHNIIIYSRVSSFPIERNRVVCFHSARADDDIDFCPLLISCRAYEYGSARLYSICYTWDVIMSPWYIMYTYNSRLISIIIIIIWCTYYALSYLNKLIFAGTKQIGVSTKLFYFFFKPMENYKVGYFRTMFGVVLSYVTGHLMILALEKTTADPAFGPRSQELSSRSPCGNPLTNAYHSHVGRTGS